MPEKNQTATFAGYDANHLQAIAYGALQHLEWNIKYAGDNVLVAYTPKKWNNVSDEITVNCLEGQISVTSKMIHGEGFDITGRNKKHIARFLAAFETVRTGANEQKLSQWKEAIEPLKGDTIKLAEIEMKEAAETEKVMNLKSGNTNLTFLIMGINVLMFILVCVSGVDVFAPAAYDLVPWGANFPPLTYSGESWRLFTNIFLHFGIIHLALNMYALYSIGIYLEPMIGKARYIAAYICTGILASVVSLLWHSDGNIASAGASGAIFGMYGVFLALLTTNLIPKSLRNTLLQSILVFVGYNVFYGFKPGSGIDNAAHLGGLISGMVIGYVFYPTLKTGSAKKTQTALGLIAIATIIVAIASLRGGGDDNKLFPIQYNEFAIAEEAALEPYKDNDITLEELDGTIIPSWDKASKILEKLSAYKLNETNAQITRQLQEYVRLRQKEANLRRKAINGNGAEYTEELNEIAVQIESIIDQLNKNPVN